MSWQAHIFVGERVHNFKEIEKIAQSFNMKLDVPVEERKNWPSIQDVWNESFPPKFIFTYDGKTFSDTPEFLVESEGGNEFPVHHNVKYTDAIVCKFLRVQNQHLKTFKPM